MSIIGVIKGDTRSLDYSSCSQKVAADIAGAGPEFGAQFWASPGCACSSGVGFTWRVRGT